ncbi:MAG: hypothetical protein LBS59_08735 [Puniceicoccales bacterium]|jgi:hypothetical protein|nr:hypothetical protein [Puniceicoccales bacterium]
MGKFRPNPLKTRTPSTFSRKSTLPLPPQNVPSSTPAEPKITPRQVKIFHPAAKKMHRGGSESDNQHPKTGRFRRNNLGEKV